MTSRKVLKKKRHCLEFSKERWSIPSIKNFACQVEINFKQPVHVQTTATQTDSVLPAPSSEVSRELKMETFSGRRQLQPDVTS